MEPQVQMRIGRYRRGLLALAHGRTLLLGGGWPRFSDPTELPGCSPSVSELLVWDLETDPPDGPFDAMVSLAELWRRPDLPGLLRVLVERLEPGAGELIFCEPTADALAPSQRPGLAHDVTGLMWAAGLSLKDWRRFSVDGEWGIPWPLVRGTARVTRKGVRAR